MSIFYIIGSVREAMELIAYARRFFFFFFFFFSFGPHRNYSFWPESSSAAVLSVRNEGTLSCLAWIATYRL